MNVSRISHYGAQFSPGKIDFFKNPADGFLGRRYEQRRCKADENGYLSLAPMGSRIGYLLDEHPVCSFLRLLRSLGSGPDDALLARLEHHDLREENDLLGFGIYIFPLLILRPCHDRYLEIDLILSFIH